MLGMFMSKIHPILMNTPMVKATLDGTKTQTRRVVKPQPVSPYEYAPEVNVITTCPFESVEKGFLACYKLGHVSHSFGKSLFPPYMPGDILYVRETWREWHPSDSECGCGGDYCTCSVRPSTPACYKADGHIIEDEDREVYGLKWKPSIHMPKRVARLFLKVTKVRVERLQQISIDDIEREGTNVSRCLGLPACGSPYTECDDCEKAMEEAARYDFETLWDSTTTKPGTRWADNPWVWVYEFEKCDKPEGWGKDA